MVTSRLTLEGCGELYAQCRRLAPDFRLRVEVWDRGRQVVAMGTVHGMLFVDQEQLNGSPMADARAMHNLLLRMHVVLRKARDGAA